jgi:hypothetical protein
MMKLCIDCRFYEPETAIYGTKSNARWAECKHPSSLAPGSPPSVVDGSVTPQHRLRCIEARSPATQALYYSGSILCGPDARYFEPA